MRIRVEGVEEVKRALDAWGNAALLAAARSVADCGEDLQGKAQALSPQLRGDLAGTANTKHGIDGTKVYAEVSFNIIYAARRHEEQYSPGPITAGKPSVDGMMPGRKYLENPTRHYRNKYLQDIADAIRRGGML